MDQQPTVSRSRAGDVFCKNGIKDIIQNLHIGPILFEKVKVSRLVIRWAEIESTYLTADVPILRRRLGVSGNKRCLKATLEEDYASR